MAVTTAENRNIFLCPKMSPSEANRGHGQCGNHQLAGLEPVHDGIVDAQVPGTVGHQRGVIPLQDAAGQLDDGQEPDNPDYGTPAHRLRRGRPLVGRYRHARVGSLLRTRPMRETPHARGEEIIRPSGCYYMQTHINLA